MVYLRSEGLGLQFFARSALRSETLDAKVLKNLLGSAKVPGSDGLRGHVPVSQLGVSFPYNCILVYNQ